MNINISSNIMEVILQKSDKMDKKYVATIGRRHIHFGSVGYSDYLHHQDVDRKNRYILRHQKREDWLNPLTPGFWSRWLLWNKPTIFESIGDIEKHFNLNIKLI